MSDDEWLDEFRANMDKTSRVRAFVISPACTCEWEMYTPADEPYWELLRRNRSCVLHGANGIF